MFANLDKINYVDKCVHLQEIKLHVREMLMAFLCFCRG